MLNKLYINHYLTLPPQTFPQKSIEQEQGIPPSFIKPMTIAYTEEESKATLRCQITGTPTPLVQWYKGDQLVVASETVQHTFDETTGECVLEILNPVPNELIVYTIQAQNTFGKAVGKAQLFVELDASKPTEKPEILKAPRVTPLEAKIVRTGSTMVFKSKYQGTPMPEIQWQKNGKEIVIDEDVTIITDSSTSTLTIKNMNRKRVGKYEIVATNKAGEARSSGSVVVSDTKETEELRAPRFVEPLQPRTVLEKDVVILEAVVESYPQSSFQWFYNAKPLTTRSDIRVVAKENKSIVIVESFTKSNVGIYTCRAENVAGSVTSTASVQIVPETQLEEVYDMISPRFTQRLQPVTLMDGEELVLPCNVIGHPTPKIQWFRNSQPLEESKGVSISQEANGQCVLTISEVFPEDAGEYTCVASNKIGEASSAVSVDIEGTNKCTSAYVYIDVVCAQQIIVFLRVL